MEQEKKIGLSINEGGAFYAHEASINFSPLQFILDFRCITPRIDPRNNEGPTLHLIHNIVMMDPYHTKQIYDSLGTMITKYEKDFGKIEMPQAMKIVQKQKKRADKEDNSAPTYFG